MVSQTNNDTNRGRGRDRRRNDEEINKIGTARMNIKMIDLFTNGKNDLISSILIKTSFLNVLAFSNSIFRFLESS